MMTPAAKLVKNSAGPSVAMPACGASANRRVSLPALLPPGRGPYWPSSSPSPRGGRSPNSLSPPGRLGFLQEISEFEVEPPYFSPPYSSSSSMEDINSPVIPGERPRAASARLPRRKMRKLSGNIAALLDQSPHEDSPRSTAEAIKQGVIAPPPSARTQPIRQILSPATSLSPPHSHRSSGSHSPSSSQSRKSSPFQGSPRKLPMTPPQLAAAVQRRHQQYPPLIQPEKIAKAAKGGENAIQELRQALRERSLHLGKSRHLRSFTIDPRGRVVDCGYRLRGKAANRGGVLTAPKASAGAALVGGRLGGGGYTTGGGKSRRATCPEIWLSCAEDDDEGVGGEEDSRGPAVKCLCLLHGRVGVGKHSLVEQLVAHADGDWGWPTTLPSSGEDEKDEDDDGIGEERHSRGKDTRFPFGIGRGCSGGYDSGADLDQPSSGGGEGKEGECKEVNESMSFLLNDEEIGLDVRVLSAMDEKSAKTVPIDVTTGDATTTAYLSTIHFIVYSIDSRESFTRAAKLLYRLYEHRRRFRSFTSSKKRLAPPLILIGNKADLERRRCVKQVEGKMLAKVYKCPFVECSALLPVGLDQLWEEVLRNVQRHKHVKEQFVADENGPVEDSTRLGRQRRASILVDRLFSGTRRFAKSCEELAAKMMAM